MEVLSHQLKSVHRSAHKDRPGSSSCFQLPPSGGLLIVQPPAASGRGRCSLRSALCVPHLKRKMVLHHPGAAAWTTTSTASDLLPASSLINKSSLHTLLYLHGPLSRRQEPRFTSTPDFIWALWLQSHGNKALSLCSGETWAIMCQPGDQADCDKEQHTERFLALFFLFSLFPLSALF